MTAGRYYVIGSTEMATKFEGSGHLPYPCTLIGTRPHGRTIIFDVVKKKPEYVERLMTQFQSMSM